jgi:hypothetical protein
MMTGDARAAAVYASIQNSPGFDKTTAAERKSITASLQAIFNADTSYIKQNAQVNPGSFQDPGGASVATAGGPTAQSGVVTAATPITGLGTLS